MLPDWELEETFERVAGHGISALELRVRRQPAGQPGAQLLGPSRRRREPGQLPAESAGHPRRGGAHRRARVRPAPRLWVDGQQVVDAVLDGAHAIDPEAPPMVRLTPPGYDRTRPYGAQFAAVRAGIERLLPQARARGVKLLYEIHVGTVAMSAARAHALLDGLDSAHVGAIFDIPNMSRVALEDTRQGMELLGPYLSYCQHRRIAPGPRRLRRARAAAVELGFLFPRRRHRRHPAGNRRPARRGLRRLPLHRGLQRARRRHQAGRGRRLPAPPALKRIVSAWRGRPVRIAAALNVHEETQGFVTGGLLPGNECHR